MSTAGAAFRPARVAGLMPSPSSMYYQNFGVCDEQKIAERNAAVQRRSAFGRSRHHSSCDGSQGLFSSNFDAQVPPADPQVEVGQSKCAVPRSTSLPKAHMSSHLSHGNLYYGQQQPLSARDYSSDHLHAIYGYRNLDNGSQVGFENACKGANYASLGDYESLRREWQSTVEKLNATMNSIKSFWSPELKKERALRKEESARLFMLQDQLKMAVMANQKQAGVIEQLEAELRYQCNGGGNSGRSAVGSFADGSIPADEVQTLCQERDMYRRDYLLSLDTVKQLEYQLDNQRQALLRKEESIKRLLDALHSSKAATSTSMNDRIDLELANSRIVDLETTCAQLEAECNDLRAIVSPKNGYNGNTLELIQKLQAEVAHYEQQLQRRNQAEENDSELQRAKLQVERLQLELGQKYLEIQALQTRLSTAEESAGDFKKHLELIKESNANKEQQLNLLQADIDTLRSKLETKNEQIDQKAQQMTDLQAERNRLLNEANLLNEQVKLAEVGSATAEKKIELLEETIRERDCEIELLRQRLHSSPAMVQQKELQDELERLTAERELWRKRCADEQERRSVDRKSAFHMHEKELNELRLAITSLQKEITDRQVFIESQTEKINDMDKQVSHLTTENDELKRLTKANGTELLQAEIGRLNDALLESRSEIDRLLKIVHNMEQEASAHSKRKTTTSIFEAAELQSMDSECQAMVMQKDRRIEELEEALKESVSITAEREIVVAQQKQLCQQLEQRCANLQMQLKSVQDQMEQNDSTVNQLKQEREDKERTIQSLQMEHRRHLEDAMKLKEEALLAAIGEKDAHIALLESCHSKRPLDDIDTLQRQKEKLLKRLKEVNAQRMGIFNDSASAVHDHLGQLTKDMRLANIDQDDDGEGIWA